MAIAGVVAAVDGSTPAEDALVWASREAAMRRRPLYAVNVYDTFEDPANASARAGFQSISEMTGTIIQDLTPRMTAAVRRSGQADAGVTVDVLYGHPVETLLELAGTDQLLVTGSRGLGAVQGVLLGSVSQEVAQYARGPVVVVPGGSHAVGGRVVVGVDGSPSSLAALRFAAEAAGLRQARLVVAHAWRDPAVRTYHGRTLPTAARWREEAQATLRDSLREGLAGVHGVKVESRLIEGPEHRALVEAAEGADLLVVGSRGRGGWRGLLLGSVSLRCLTLSEVPVAVVRGAQD